MLQKTFSRSTIVFDLDGTVADTAPDLIDATNAALIAEGFFPASGSAIRHGVGYGSKVMLQAALAEKKQVVDEVMLARLTEHLLSHYEANIAVKTTVFDGFVDAAETLLGWGATLAICTNKPEKLALKLLNSLNIACLFEKVAGGDTFLFRKPDPRHILALIQLPEGGRAPAVMIGDSEADILAAKAAAVPVIAVSFGYARVPAEQLGADMVLNHFNELPKFAEKMLGVECV